MAAEVTRTFDVEIDLRVDGADDLGDQLLSALGAGLEDPVVGHDVVTATITVAGGVTASDPMTACRQAVGVVAAALAGFGVVDPQFVGLKAVLVEAGALAA